MSKSIFPDKQLKEMKKYLREKSIPVEVSTPSQMNEDFHRTLLKHLGFIIREKNGNQFLMHKYPKGWRKRRQANLKDFCYLMDGSGRKRAAIFYKYLGGATVEELKELGIPLEYGYKFRKISSHINYMPRYRTKIDHVVPFDPTGVNGAKHYNSSLIGKVLDSEIKVMFETEERKMPVEFEEGAESKGVEYFTAEANLRTELYVECETWLNRKYPDHANIIKYWDDTS